MTAKKYAFCPQCGAEVAVTANTYISGEPEQVCIRRCGWKAPLPGWWLAAEKAAQIVPRREDIETKEQGEMYP